jgi:O-methyltransferase involved in polyketide biosynthesis
MPDVIEVRNEILPTGEREINLGYNLNDEHWMDEIDSSHGTVFFASGVFYYFKAEAVKELLKKMAKRFPGAVIVFDSCNQRGAKMMTKTWLKEAGISDVNALFSVEDKSEIEAWSNDFAAVNARSYMRGYRDIYNEVSFFHKLMIKFCDSMVKMQIIKITFR